VGEAGVAGTDDSDVVTLVGRGSTVGKGVSLAAGSRLEPGTTA
jgi:glucose-1-phosphate adenylyltransferase